MATKTANLFALSEGEQLEQVQEWVRLLQIGSAWSDLASVYEQVRPYFDEVAQRIQQRLKEHPFTDHIADITPIFKEVLPYYFKMENRRWTICKTVPEQERPILKRASPRLPWLQSI
ncbi:hypothetical protein [Thermus sp.]|uniref:hypothetical protein n=1 Tax=Thermus sp. TaxID=275 RepID=UPI003D0C32AC